MLAQATKKSINPHSNDIFSVGKKKPGYQGQPGKFKYLKFISVKF
jgi:hypothetical protein